MTPTTSSADRSERSGTTRIELLPVLGRRLLHVVRVETITPAYRRIVFTAANLGTEFPFRDFAPTDHVKLFFPDPRTGELVLPVVTDRGWEYPDGSGAPIFRDYTVRAVDPLRSELMIDFVLHDHGTAGRWASRARPGDVLGQLGPRGHVLHPLDYPRYVVAGDETALPAVARFIEEAPAGSHMTAVIEVADAAEEQPLDAADGLDLDLRWVHRDTAPISPAHSSALETALRTVDISPDEYIFVFVAGEATALTPIRRYLRRELGLPKEQVDVDGYWKRGVSNLDHHSEDSTGG
ncbi:siderophore-interacting protein [Brachybacterium saurashtrense]|uniref:Siderophore-interacting protein n=1 Tax=Brachybacterium saurashtrense TaxID=556288 RepID=A0A345YQ54_9MICO|nr:siderophore-interacting protein [Brachybacterium saurashtrense]AXK46056.1 siderophore-interacting protein [Brachybacterium saurashtrense]RRR23796.1 siderophore-interacting protein [Brachybacterium saurashtrense]